MTDTNRDWLDDAGLEALLTEARDNRPAPSPALLARIVDDAGAELDRRDAAAQAARGRRGGTAKSGLVAALLASLGGWPALAGLATATVAGVWLGYAGPDTLGTTGVAGLITGSGSTVSYTLDDLVPVGGDFTALLEGS